MGISKTVGYTETQQRMAELAKAFSHPARIAILQELIQQKTCICGDLVEVLPLSQSTVSQHLKELRAVGIITGEIEGPKTCYCINPEVWQEAQQAFGLLWEDYKRCC